MKDGLGLKERVEAGESWENEQQTGGSGKAKPFIPLETPNFFGGLSVFWVGDVHNYSCGLPLNMFLYVLFSPSFVYRFQALLLFLHNSDFNKVGKCVCKEVVVNAIMYVYVFIRPAVGSYSMQQSFVECRGEDVKSVVLQQKDPVKLSISWKQTKEQQQKDESVEKNPHEKLPQGLIEFHTTISDNSSPTSSPSSSPRLLLLHHHSQMTRIYCSAPPAASPQFPGLRRC